MPKKYYIIIPAYNEEKTIGKCFDSILGVVSKAKPKFCLEQTFVCINGCTDETERVVKKYQQSYPNLKIKILHSPKGMVRALCKIIDSIPSSLLPIIKLDADTVVDPKSFQILLKELEKHTELQIVGGQPVAFSYQGKNLYKKFLANVLDVRSRHPMSQVAAHDVTKFHRVAENDPQSTIPPSYEKQSRIYFHGRFYVLRNKHIWRVPPDRIGDDTYLALDIYKHFGPDSIRIRYDALCYYYPSTSIISHWKAYKRIFCDTYTLFRLPEFRDMKDFISLEQVKLDWGYINKLPIKLRFYFFCYSAIKGIENILFKISPKYTEDLWAYNCKRN